MILNKSGPVKATLSSSKYKSTSMHANPAHAINPPSQKLYHKRPQSSTFINTTSQKDSDLVAKSVGGPTSTTNSKPISKQGKLTTTKIVKKMNKRVRSASPGNLANYLTQKQGSVKQKQKQKQNRAIGGSLYKSNNNNLF